MTGRESLDRNAAAYAHLLGLVGRLSRRSRAAAALIRFTAEFCEFNHPGRFADGALENPLFDLAADVPEVPTPVSKARPVFSRRRVLHMATQVAGVGGHTRSIRHWVEADPASCHSLMVTAQGREPVPVWLREAIDSSGGDCHVLPFPACPLARAAQARAGVRQLADLVVLHHFGHDVVPILALAADGPPVALVNHADHMFWLGGTVADVVVHQRDIGRTLNHRRHVHRDVVLPVPLAEAGEVETRAAARARLGIPADQVMLLSVGRACKYVPTRSHNFFRTASRILDGHPQAHLYLLGVAVADVAGLDAPRHTRFHFLGPRDSAAKYQRAADVYLEGFPFGSQTALLEAALAGVPVVPAFAPPLRLLATSDEALAGLADTPEGEDGYVERVGTFVCSAEARVETGRALREAVRASHVGGGWKARLATVYRCTDGLIHRPKWLPATPADSTADDLALSAWQASRASGAGDRPSQTAAREVVRAAAFGLREAACHATAFTLLRHAIRSGGPHHRLLGDIVKLLPHRVLTDAPS